MKPTSASIPPYRCKNADFDSLDELRLVSGMFPKSSTAKTPTSTAFSTPTKTTAISPTARQPGRSLDSGILEYLTVWSRESNASRTNLNDSQAAGHRA
jgi:hypothetical protein